MPPSDISQNPTSESGFQLGSRLQKFTIACILLLFLPGCLELDYYLHSITGHLQVISKSQSISDLLDDSSTPEHLQQRLLEIEQIRNYASDALLLPENDSYRSYVELDRPYVVWNVVAAPELSLEPLEWCFPIVGCMSYRGYFEASKAEQFARKLEKQGYDTIVIGVPAYSTLSWFDDPVLSTFSNWPLPEVAKLLFHELAHQKLYVPGDTAFNESFATAVEQFGIARWLTQEEHRSLAPDVAIKQQRQKRFLNLLQNTREKLKRLYASQQTEDLKRQQKQKIFATMHEDYQQLRSDWQDYPGYDIWFEKLNNARIAATDNYQRWVPAFKQLMDQENQELESFYQRSQTIADLPDKQRHQLLDRLVKENLTATGKQQKQ